MGSIEESAPSTSIPTAIPGKTFFPIAPGIALIQPLSHRGYGPGILVLTDENDGSGTTTIKNGFPSPAMKWAEEGYTVVEIRSECLGGRIVKDPIDLAIDTLQACDKCEPKNVVGLVAYTPTLLQKLSESLQKHPEIVGHVIYDDAASTSSITNLEAQAQANSVPSVRHLAGKASSKLPRTAHLTAYDYPSSSSFTFATPFSNAFHSANEAVSHTRNLTFLKKLMNGPYFDLEQIWDEHTYYEFGDRSTEKTMATMVQEPYVNHVPTLTGGIGRTLLSDFYQNHFIFNNPEGTELELISRTVGIDRIVDEFIFKFDHNKMIDWLLPGIPPTGKRAEVPFMAVVNVRGDRLYHEHIAWDQANALRQIGLLPEYLPYPYPVPGADGSTKQGNLEYRVPAAGIEAANKMRDKNSVLSNQMFEYQLRERKG